ncbi:MAG: AbrB/MazE/SpoVT family DNA-binding domain-containing protein [Clostridia bacterium]|nr:AbrB/MazE/SpoVT family DNA-binding domain-containing protein [Clostridia bacterium]
MKATGIVRRIDDLGRVVIPKEIRRTLRIREGDPLEIYTDAQGEVIFKKYSPIGELSKFADTYCEVLAKMANFPTIVSDRDHVVAAAGIPKKEYLERRITSPLEELMDSRKSFILSKSEESSFYPIEGINRSVVIVYPIIAAGDAIGAILMLSNKEKALPTEVEAKIAQTAAMFIGKQMEE